jgi:hypothetical protein
MWAHSSADPAHITNAADAGWKNKHQRLLLPTLPSSLVNYCPDGRRSNGAGQRIMAQMGVSGKKAADFALSENGIIAGVVRQPRIFIYFGGTSLCLSGA